MSSVIAAPGDLIRIKDCLTKERPRLWGLEDLGSNHRLSYSDVIMVVSPYGGSDRHGTLVMVNGMLGWVYVAPERFEAVT